METAAPIQVLIEKVAALEASIQMLVKERTIKEFYTTAEVARLVGKAEFTVREWCRLGRVHAEKRACGRGLSREWVLSYEELERVRNHGLLPIPRR